MSFQVQTFQLGVHGTGGLLDESSKGGRDGSYQRWSKEFYYNFISFIHSLIHWMNNFNSTLELGVIILFENVW